MKTSKKDPSLYIVIKNKIIEEIQSGDYKVGDKLPTEMKLCKKYNASRTTIRLALQQLALEGRIYRVQGNGTFVSKPKIQQSLTAGSKGFTEQMIEQGYKPQIITLHLDVIRAGSLLSENLQIDENDPVFKLVRLRKANEEPMKYEVSYIPWKIAPGLKIEECNGSLFKLLKTKYQVNVYNTIESIEPILANQDVSEFLHLSEGSPIFYLETITKNIDNIPIEYSEEYFRGDRYRLTIERFYQ